MRERDCYTARGKRGYLIASSNSVFYCFSEKMLPEMLPLLPSHAIQTTELLAALGTNLRRKERETRRNIYIRYLYTEGEKAKL